MRTILFTLVLFATHLASAEICTSWAQPTKVGTLNTEKISESSGIAFSRKFKNRLYHINDSGDGPSFYITDSLGNDTKDVVFTEQNPIDVEDIAVGPCGTTDCIFIADIGDNEEKRTTIDIWVITEAFSFSDKVEAKKYTFQYPDHPHNAEAFAVHPVTGSLLILTKEVDFSDRRARPASLFQGSLEDQMSGRPAQLERIGEVDLPWMNFAYSIFGHQATAMDISSDGTNVLILTYENALEVSFKNLTKPIQSRNWEPEKDFSIIDLSRMTSQQEAIAYAPDGNGFYFSSEFNAPADTDAPLIFVKCLSRK